MITTVLSRYHYRSGVPMPVVLRGSERRRRPGLELPLDQPRALGRARGRHQGGLPGVPRRREGSAEVRRPRRQPRDVPGAQVDLPPDQGARERGPRPARADRRGARAPPGRRRQHHHVRRDGPSRARGGRGARRRATSPSRWSTCAPCTPTTRRPCCDRSRRRRARSCSRSRTASRGSAPRSPRRSPRRRSSTSMHRSSGSRPPNLPVPFSPPLEDAFLPQVADIEAAVDRLSAW